jgi:hypothetical protein
MDLKGGMKLVLTIEMNTLAFTKLILSMEDKISNSKVAFNSVNGYKKEILCRWKRKYGWEKLRNKLEPSPTPSLVKMEKHFRQYSDKNQM